MICKIITPDGRVIHIEGFADGDFMYMSSKPRKWWKETENGFDFIADCGKVFSVIPLNKQEFLEKHLKNLPDSVESPFTFTIKNSP